MRITIELAQCHGSCIHRNESCPLATNTNEAAPAIALRMRPSAAVATISLPLAANPTIHPTNIDRMTRPMSRP
jgi:hypothetical protein